MIKKIIISVIIFICVFVNYSVNAHEMYPYNGTYIELRFSHLDQNNNLDVKITGTYLSSKMLPYYSYNAFTWERNCSEIEMTETLNSPNVYVTTPSYTSWEGLVGSAYKYLATGICYLQDTNGYTIITPYSAYASNKLIDIANIYISPYDGTVSGDFNRFATYSYIAKCHVITHEIGHAFGLGHPDKYSDSDNPLITSSYNSIMYSVISDSDSYFTPRSHDITDISDRY